MAPLYQANSRVTPGCVQQNINCDGGGRRERIAQDDSSGGVEVPAGAISGMWIQARNDLQEQYAKLGTADKSNWFIVDLTCFFIVSILILVISILI